VIIFIIVWLRRNGDRKAWGFLAKWLLVHVSAMANNNCRPSDIINILTRKGKVHPCTGTEAPYRPQGEKRYSSTLS